MAYTTIDNPAEYFTAKTYTGTGSTQSITGLEFSPDLVWIKQRSAIRSHVLYDVIRGATKDLRSNDTTAEATDAATLSSFNSDGFTVVTDDKVNVSSGTYVAWAFDANGAGVSNTAGTISSTVSANTTSGFSIVSYTGNGSASATVGHGLGVTPEFLIIKNRTNTYNWAVYHKNLGNTGGLFLNTTSAFTTDADLFNNTSPTSSVVTFSNSTLTNQGSANHIMYAFNSVKGYSKFGSYTGNGSTDGPFVYTGFKPAFLIAKRTSSTGNWRTRDNKRSTFNAVELVLNPNLSAADTTEDAHDFLSNGFKVRTSGPENNSSGGTFIYMAFAENPFVSSTGIPTTAR